MEMKHEADEYEARLSDVISVVQNTLRRRWKVFAAVSLGVIIVGIVLISLITPMYSATAKIRLAPENNSPTATAQRTPKELSDEAIETEASSVRSLEVARSVVQSEDLMGDPDYAKALETRTSSTTTPEARETIVANALLEDLSVSRESLSFNLNISFSARDPIKAARLANAFARNYLELRRAKRGEAARQQNIWFQERLDELGRDAAAAEGRAAAFRSRAGILESGTGGTIVDQQVAPLAGSLAAAESEAAAARASLEAARSQMARGGLESVSRVLDSQVIADLRRQRAQVMIENKEINERYGSRHPEAIRIQGQLESLDRQIAAEARRVVSSLEAAAAAANARAQSLAGSLSNIESQREQSAVSNSTAYALEREAEAKRALYDNMSKFSLDTTQDVTEQFEQTEFAPATPPTRPSRPNKPLLYGLAFLVGLAAGAAVIAIQEMLSGGFQSVEELESQTGLAVLAVVPKVDNNEAPAQMMLERPTSMFSESFRIARTAIFGGAGNPNIKVIAITSSLPAEGKTTSAVAFARTLAIAGSRTLLLECDIRRAAVQQVLQSSPPKQGIVEVLHGEVDVDAAIDEGDVPNLYQLLTVSPYFSAENLFGEGRMETLLTELRERFDYIVLDLPPLMGLADGRYLATLADATALIVKWRSTPVSAVKSAVNWLRSDGARPIGAIFTQVDGSAHSVGGLYYYSKQYAGYYQAQ
jgi:polysaccharide biosynthesis transport protein